MKSAGVPVLVSVAAILRATTPEVPAPVVATLPAHAASSSTACAKRAGSSRSAIDAIASASCRRRSAGDPPSRSAVSGSASDATPRKIDGVSAYSLGSAASWTRPSGVRAAMTGDLGSASSGAPSGSS